MKLVDTKLKLCDLGTNPFCIETKEEQIKLHTITLCVGKRGSGKSFFISNLLGWLNFDKVILISPTAESNFSQFKHLNIEPNEIFDPDDPDVIAKVIAIGNQERDDLIEYRQKKQMLTRKCAPQICAARMCEAEGPGGGAGGVGYRL